MEVHRFVVRLFVYQLKRGGWGVHLVLETLEFGESEKKGV